MRTDDMNLVTNAVSSLVSIMRNLPFFGTNEEKQILQILFLDKYFQNNLNYEVGILEIDKAEMSNNHYIVSELKNRYYYAFDMVGVFREKSASSIGISNTASDILRRLGIQCNTLEGHIEIKSIYGSEYYPHQWNEIKIGNNWYCYDFTLNIISHNWKNDGYKPALKFIKLPVTPVDYSFIDRQSKNFKLGGYTNPKRGPIKRDLSLLEDDFSKYTIMDRSKLLNAYMDVEKIYKAMNI